MSDFDDFWLLEVPWFEEPNHRRGGWSGVVKHQLTLDGNNMEVFIKRQENHQIRTLLHPISGIPTFEAEYVNIQRLHKAGVPTLTPVYFSKAGRRAILITQSLVGFTSLDSLSPTRLTPASKQQLLLRAGQLVAGLHQHRFKHGSLYPKHLFAMEHHGDWQIRVIDLERMRKVPFRQSALLRDLGTLHRHAGEEWTLRDRLRFFHAYVGEKILSPKNKRLLRSIMAKIDQKRR